MFLAWTTWQFVLAGIAFAAGPILIHLLNRRRVRVVPWAAMHLLREAFVRQQRRLRLRDWLLLVLRTAAILMFGSALARPFFSSTYQDYDSQSPIHAVLLVDNSLSMSYLAPDGPLLDQAKTRCLAFVRRLPPGSIVNVIPACGNEIPLRPDPYTRLDEIRSALDAIQIVDQPVHLNDAVNRTRQACQIASQLTKRIVFFTDQQKAHWTGAEDIFDNIASLQIVDVAPITWENTWISELRVQDGLADTATPTTFLVRLQHHGPQPRRNLPVTLIVDEEEVATKTVTLSADQDRRELIFEYTFSNFDPVPGIPLYVPVRVVLPPDRLTADNERCLAVPVVTDLPLVFVDQYTDAEEDAAKNQFGETYQLRRLLAPRIPRDPGDPPVFRIRHLSAAQLNQQQREALADARLVVVAGVADPGPIVRVLREYVMQGGRLIVAAGGHFDHDLWNHTAWKQGDGILPAKLTGVLGQLPELAAKPKVFSLAFDSMVAHRFFRLPGVSEEELEDLFSEPAFFKAVGVDVGESARQSLYQRDLNRLTRWADRGTVLSGEANSSAQSTDLETTQGADTREPTAGYDAQWLVWQTPHEATDLKDLPSETKARKRLLESLAADGLPRIRARYANSEQSPFLVDRKIGHGSVIFVSSGFLPRWNTLAQTHAFLMFDRIVRFQVHATLPIRDFPVSPRIVVNVAPVSRTVDTRIWRPHRRSPDTVDAGLLNSSRLTVEVLRPFTRGIYRIATRDDTTDRDFTTPISVNGPSEESNLAPLSRDSFARSVTAKQVRWLGHRDTPSLAGVTIRGQNLWRWLIGGVILFLLIESIILIRRRTQGPAKLTKRFAPNTTTY